MEKKRKKLVVKRRGRLSVSEGRMRKKVCIGCSCSPWGGLLFDPVVQRHTKRRRKRQDPTDSIERGSKTKDGETHDKAGGNEEDVQGQTASR